MREVAYHHIQRKISLRELRAGAPVSDVGIAKELGISRTPAREAIRQLVSEGLLESVAGRGVVVITLDRDDIRELYEMREALEGLAARTVAARSPSAGEMRDFRFDRRRDDFVWLRNWKPAANRHWTRNRWSASRWRTLRFTPT